MRQQVLTPGRFPSYLSFPPWKWSSIICLLWAGKGVGGEMGNEPSRSLGGGDEQLGIFILVFPLEFNLDSVTWYLEESMFFSKREKKKEKKIGIPAWILVWTGTPVCSSPSHLVTVVGLLSLVQVTHRVSLQPCFLCSYRQEEFPQLDTKPIFSSHHLNIFLLNHPPWILQRPHP